MAYVNTTVCRAAFAHAANRAALDFDREFKDRGAIRPAGAAPEKRFSQVGRGAAE
jgi:hypothetical protein